MDQNSTKQNTLQGTSTPSVNVSPNSKPPTSSKERDDTLSSETSDRENENNHRINDNAFVFTLITKIQTKLLLYLSVYSEYRNTFLSKYGKCLITVSQVNPLTHVLAALITLSLLVSVL